MLAEDVASGVASDAGEGVGVGLTVGGAAGTNPVEVLTAVLASLMARAVQENFKSTMAGSSRSIVKPFEVTAAITKSCLCNRYISFCVRTDRSSSLISQIELAVTTGVSGKIPSIL